MTSSAPKTGVVVNEDIQENSVVRFLFEEHGVRGEILHMKEPLERLLKGRNYPKSVQSMLMQLATAAVLMATTLKANGTVTVQMQGGEGDKALRFAFINIDKDLNFYGSASMIEGVDYSDASFNDLVGKDGILVISVFPEDGNRYQGIIALTKPTLSEAIEDYFKESEQLATTMIIHHDVDNFQAGGLMLQIIPNIDDNVASLEHLTVLGNSLTSNELFNVSLNECLRRLFWNDKIRVFSPESTDFKCTCNKQRCCKSISGLPHEDIEEIAQDPNGITITCHNCGTMYHLSQEEIRALLHQNAEDDGHEAIVQEDHVSLV